MNNELLLEIGTEEIPASFIPEALSALAVALEKELKNNRLSYACIKTMGTPRRLVAIIENLSEKQDALIIEKIGPARNLAFDRNGNPTQAALGFARSQGVELSQLEIIKNDKGEYLCVRKREEGRDAQELLAEFLPKVITSIPFKKSMRWGNSEISFARPIHWITAVFKEKVVPFCIGEIASGNLSYGHRFLAPEPFEVKNSLSYLESLRKAYVVVDPEERKRIIWEEIKKVAASVSGFPIEDEDLLQEVTYLVEYPVVLLGSFPSKYLKLPEELLITCMKSHQKYFPVFNKEKHLLPYFIVVTNTLTKKPQVVIKGNERVLLARLADAQFYFEEDLKIPLSERVEKLKGVLFHSQLGTSYEKVERFKTLAVYIANLLFPELKSDIEKTALLCKADLVTGMVREFPELQGVMGKEYALRSGEKQEIAEAIFEHYLPRFSGDRIPEGHIGAIVSIADKLDTIVGFFGVGLIPTGVADPYALRRQALGIINILLEKKYPLSLKDLLNKSISLLTDKLLKKKEEIQEEVMEFFKGRLANQLITQGYSYDVVEAALSRNFDNPLECFLRIQALQKMKEEPYFESLTITFKRAMNIIKEKVETEINPLLFEIDAEKDLFSTYQIVKKQVVHHLKQQDYLTCLKEIAKLKRSIDKFFDRVMVMVDDEKIKKNRLALLSKIVDLFEGIADFSKIITG